MPIGILILSAVFVVFLIYLLINCQLKKKKLESDFDFKNQEISRLKKENDDFYKTLRELNKFRCCADAEKEAVRIIDKANDDAEYIKRDAELYKNRIWSEAVSKSNTIIEEAQAEAAKIIETANLKAEETQVEATKIIESANSKAEEAQAQIDSALKTSSDIINNARIKAETEAQNITAGAYKISKSVDYYNETLKAIQNTINGYGTEYIKPNESVLDELAGVYSFTEAGQKLAEARLISRRLVRLGLAGSCDYVEKNRHDTAVYFVVDAFNGKVDSILSLIKKNNYGTLERKIQNAYFLVNALGQSFRSARITPEYLEARLNELKWGVAVVVIREKDREEQRAIKERIREEERARKEYEKAIRESQKQEDSIKKAIEKATAQLEKSNLEQRAKYEAQLSELQIQLAEAEARNQRALSMAQQTRSGHVYIISNIGSFGENVYKIGMTRRLEPLDRVRELGDASVPFPFDVHAMIYSEDAPTLETELHKYFAKHQMNKVNPKKEFFKTNLDDIKSYLDGKEIQVQWTLKAEAAQYWESIALEKAFLSNSNLESNWLSQQNEQIEDIENLDEDEIN